LRGSGGDQRRRATPAVATRSCCYSAAGSQSLAFARPPVSVRDAMTLRDELYEWQCLGECLPLDHRVCSLMGHATTGFASALIGPFNRIGKPPRRGPVARCAKWKRCRASSYRRTAMLTLTLSLGRLAV
jgi:hypothetical protein